MHRTHLRRSLAGPLTVAMTALAAPSALGAVPDPASGWHGRAIRDPRPADADIARRGWPRGWSAHAVRLGSGFAHPSRRVREIQRRLLRRGYRTGRVDGRFGRRTRAALTWFQIKHGLARSGAADRATVAALRAHPLPVPIAAAVAIPEAVHATGATTAGGVPGLAVIAFLLALAAIGFVTGSASFGRRTGPAPDAPVADPRPPTEVLGYVLTPVGGSAARQSAAIAAWCVRSDWDLRRVVHDVRDSGQRADRRLGLAYALREIDEGRAAGLVCERLSDVADSPAELLSLLQWFVERTAFLRALDLDMDVPAAALRIAAGADG